jgi:hypothetical protein
MYHPVFRLGLIAFLLLPLMIGGCKSGNNSNDKELGGGPQNLIRQRPLSAGSAACIKGGARTETGVDDNGDGILNDDEVDTRETFCNPTSVNRDFNFNRLATFPVCAQIGQSCTDDTPTAAEIIAASADGFTLIYTDSPAKKIGFVDITDPGKPTALGALALQGEPTSVAVIGNYALVAVNKSADFVHVAGSLEIINIAARSFVHSIELYGQPDSIAISPDGTYAAIVIENERDEELETGAPPQAPSGYLSIVKLLGEPVDWTATQVDLTGLAELYPGDAEPEYVDINSNNVAAISLQENNHLVLVDLPTATVIHHFSAGAVDLNQIDSNDEKAALISLSTEQRGVLREPDGVAWINSEYFATADEGDLDGGSRGFTVFSLRGEVVFSSGNELEHLAVRLGHYPDDRSDNKGNEPENVEVGIFGGERFLFVASERASLIFVYDAADPRNPVFKQALPVAMAPEGILAIPSRNLLIAAGEEDNRADGVRSSITIYRYAQQDAAYPTIESADRADGTPIPWGAISGLATDRHDHHILYAVDDSYYQRNRIFKLDISEHPAILREEIYLRDSNSMLPAELVNVDKTVNIDPEGIAHASDGGFWVASEGDGSFGDPDKPVNSVNLIIKTNNEGVVEQVFPLPDPINEKQIRFGFEGIAESDGLVYVAFQRAWMGDAQPRIGVLNPIDCSWQFFFYPLDEAESPNGGWVGLSDLTAIGNGEFLAVERDNQAGPDARVKKLYKFSVAGLTDGDAVEKSLQRDLITDLHATGGLIPEKIEGLAVSADGSIYITNDNDGVKGSNGETQILILNK